jgi:hypothetical protein
MSCERPTHARCEAVSLCCVPHRKCLTPKIRIALTIDHSFSLSPLITKAQSNKSLLVLDSSLPVLCERRDEKQNETTTTITITTPRTASQHEAHYYYIIFHYWRCLLSGPGRPHRGGAQEQAAGQGAFCIDIV